MDLLERAVAPFVEERTVLVTHLPPEECEARLRERVRPLTLLGGLRVDPRFLLGEVTASGFHVRIPGRSYMPQATGQFVAIPGGTRIEVRIDVPEMGKRIFPIPLFMAGLVWGVTLVALAAGSEQVDAAWLLGLSLVTALFVWATAQVRRLAQADRVAYVKWLRRHLEADETAGPSRGVVL